VAGLVDVVDESEELCYIDDDASLAIKDLEAPPLQPQSNPEGAAVNPGGSSGLKAQDPIDLDAPEIEESAAHASRSPPPVSDDLCQAAAKAADEITPVPAMTSNVLQFEDANKILLLKYSFSCFFYKPRVPFTDVFCFCADFSGQDSGHLEHQGQGERGIQDKPSVCVGRTWYDTTPTALFIAFRLGAIAIRVTRRGLMNNMTVNFLPILSAPWKD
jgi:hypothetical protein